MAEPTLDDVASAIAARVAVADLESLGAVLHDALAQIGPLLTVERAYLIGVESRSGHVVLADEWFVDGSRPALSTVLGMGPLAREEEIRRRLAGLGVRSVLMVPAKPAGSLIGTVFVATASRSYRPSIDVLVALQTVVDAFMARLVGIRTDHSRLAMRNQLGTAKPEPPRTTAPDSGSNPGL